MNHLSKKIPIKENGRKDLSYRKLDLGGKCYYV